MSLVARNALIALGITFLVVATVVYAVDRFNGARVRELSTLQQQLSIDSLSLETQISLLESAPCSVSASGTDLTSELDDLGQRLSYTENQLGENDEQVVLLKQQYSLLEIRDYLVTTELAHSCGTKQVPVLYFYSDSGDCSDCDRAGYALSYLRENYPNIRVYSFDYHLDLGALATLLKIERIKGTLPAFIINGKTYYGFTDLATLESEFPKGTIASSTATSTKQ